MSKHPQPQSKQLTRKQLSRREAEQRFERRVVIGAVAVLAVVVLIIAYGLIDLYVLTPRQPVATVAGVPIRLNTYQKLLQYRRYDYHSYISELEEQEQQYASSDDSSIIVQIIEQQISYVESELSYLYSTVYEELIEDEITRQECATRGITVSDEEVQLELETQFGYERYTPTPTATSVVTATLVPTSTPVTATLPITATATPAPTATPTAVVTPTATLTLDEFNTNASEWLSSLDKTTGFGEQDFRELLRATLLRDKLEEAIGAEVSLTADQVHAEQILVATQEDAEAVVARLNAGEEWDALAAELSQDSTTADSGGDLGWFPKGQKGDTFDEAVFAEETPDPTNTLIFEDDSGFHVVRVLERDTDRYLSEDDLESARSDAVTAWFNERSAAEDVVRLLDYDTMVPADPWETSD